MKYKNMKSLILNNNPSDFGVTFTDADNEGHPISLLLTDMMYDWKYEEKCCCADETAIRGVSFFNDSTGQVYVIESSESREIATFVALMKFIDELFQNDLQALWDDLCVQHQTPATSQVLPTNHFEKFK